MHNSCDYFRMGLDSSVFFISKLQVSELLGISNKIF